MPDDLFTPIDNAKRLRLKALGWAFRGYTISGAPLWLRPDGLASLEEEEAFRQLDQAEISRQDMED